MKQPPLVRVSYLPPSNGWLTLSVHLEEKIIEIDASDVPNNPIQDLIVALQGIARGSETYVWWHLEPAGYFMYFQRMQNEVQLRIEYEDNSKRGRAREVAMIRGCSRQVLMPFWRFLREFQSHRYTEPNWPQVDCASILELKLLLEAANPV